MTPWSDVSRELRGLLDRAYELGPNNRLVVRDEAQATALRQRLDRLRDQVLSDPRLAAAYDRSEITRFVYLTLPTLDAANRGLLYRLIRGEISIVDTVREADRAEVQHAIRYNGRQDATEDDFSRRHQIMGDALRQIVDPIPLSQALQMSATEISRDARLVTDANDRTRLAAMDMTALRHEYETLSGGWANRPEGTERAGAFRRLTYLSFLLTSRGQTSMLDSSVQDCRSQYAQTDEASCRLVSGIHLAVDSPSPFDNGRLRPELLVYLGQYYNDYLQQSPAQRISQQSIVLDAELGRALTAGQFGEAFSTAGLRGILEAAERASGRSHIPPERPTPLTLADIRAVGSRSDAVDAIGSDPIEARLSDIPREWRDAAQQINVTVPRPTDIWTGTLWDYLQRNVDSVVFTRHGPQLGGDRGEPMGTANRLMRTVIIDVDGAGSATPPEAPGVPEVQDPSAWRLFGTLAHEAYHNDFFTNHVPQDARLARATTLNERNAHLFEGRVLTEVLRSRAGSLQSVLAASGQVQVSQQAADQGLNELEFLMLLTGTQRLTGLSANIALNFPADDAELYSYFNDSTSVESLGRYPTAYTDRYLQRRGMNRERFLAHERGELMSVVGRLAVLLRHRASESHAGTSTVGSR